MRTFAPQCSITATIYKLYKRRSPGSRPDLGDGGTAAVGHPGAYKELAAKGLVPWETAQDIGAVQGPRRAEELNTVLDPAAGHFDVGGASDRHLGGLFLGFLLHWRLPLPIGPAVLVGPLRLLAYVDAEGTTVSPRSEITQDRVEVLCTVEDANHRDPLFSQAVEDLMSLESGDGP